MVVSKVVSTLSITHFLARKCFSMNYTMSPHVLCRFLLHTRFKNFESFLTLLEHHLCSFPQSFSTGLWLYPYYYVSPHQVELRKFHKAVLKKVDTVYLQIYHQFTDQHYHLTEICYLPNEFPSKISIISTATRRTGSYPMKCGFLYLISNFERTQ